MDYPQATGSSELPLNSPSWLPDSPTYYCFQYENPCLGGLQNFPLLFVIPNTEQGQSPIVTRDVVAGGKGSQLSAMGDISGPRG